MWPTNCIWPTTYVSEHTTASLTCTIMASSNHEHRQDKTVLSCLIGSVNWVRYSCRHFSIYWRHNSFVLSAVWRHLWTSFDPVSKYDVTISNHVANWKQDQNKTRLSSHRISKLDKTVSKSTKLPVADSLDLSPIQFTQWMLTRQDKRWQCKQGTWFISFMSWLMSSPASCMHYLTQTNYLLFELDHTRHCFHCRLFARSRRRRDGCWQWTELLLLQHARHSCCVNDDYNVIQKYQLLLVKGKDTCSNDIGWIVSKQSTSTVSYITIIFTLETVRQQTASVTCLLVGFLSAAPLHHLEFCFFLQNRKKPAVNVSPIKCLYVFYYSLFYALLYDYCAVLATFMTDLLIRYSDGNQTQTILILTVRTMFLVPSSRCESLWEIIQLIWCTGCWLSSSGLFTRR